MLQRVIAAYTEAVVDTDRHRAIAVVHDAVDHGVSPEDVLFRVVVPSLESMIKSISESFDASLAQHFMASQIAAEVTEEILKERGLPLTDEAKQRWGARFANEIDKNPRLKRIYFRGNPERAVRKAAESLFEDLGVVATRKADATKQAEKERLSHLPKPHGGSGGTGETKAPTAPKTLAESMTGFRERLAEINRKGG